jgi:hypothetical protein
MNILYCIFYITTKYVSLEADISQSPVDYSICLGYSKAKPMRTFSLKLFFSLLLEQKGDGPSAWGGLNSLNSYFLAHC